MTPAVFVHAERPCALRRTLSTQLHHGRMDHTESGGPACNHQAHWTTYKKPIWADSAGLSKQAEKNGHFAFSGLYCFYVLDRSMSFGEMFIKHLLFWEMFTKHLEIEGCVICSMQSAVKVISVSFFLIFFFIHS